ncbi:MAG TPA: putative glycolipid-binding domain-containing protein [Pyrinomonadaceae bacterium]|nr:putative glycolipid-binding domain-containing protein [Pyrinomonadaceae bacterium]
MTDVETILWRRIDTPGHEAARVFLSDNRWHLSGAAVFEHEANACKLNYALVCDSEWQTISGSVEGWIGDEIVKAEISVDAERRWQLNGKDCAEVSGCVDLDLNFSPLTNLLPIRRLNLAAGEEAPVRTAWLRFPSFKLELLEQVYSRIDDSRYRYESAGGQFVAELTVNEFGLVTDYPPLWRSEGVKESN